VCSLRGQLLGLMADVGPAVDTRPQEFSGTMPQNREADKNVVGGSLLPCSTDPMTGFYRDGCCATGPEDIGSHTVCATVPEKFLEFSETAGNDLSTPED
jgi:uncharacterized protein (DUF2237 family)